jgi:hypothetical protein
MAAAALTVVSGGLNLLWQLLNSNFSAALLGTSVGAIVAWWIAQRNERRRKLLEEIRATNAAINVAFALTNTYLNLKAQHVKKLAGEYNSQKTSLEEVRERTRGGEPQTKVFEFLADFQTLSPPRPSVAVLQDLLFEKISVTGRALLAFTTLAQAVTGLTDVLEMRNGWIAQHKAKGSVPDEALVALYFGQPNANGQVDVTYPDMIDSILRQTDDCIFYGDLVIKDLVLHGRGLRAGLGSGAPRIHEPNFSAAKAAGLFPDESLYENWLAGIKTPEAELPIPWIERATRRLLAGC